MEKVRLGDIASFSKGKQINVSNLISNGKYDFLNGGINPSGKWNDFNVNENSIAISEGGNSCGYVNFMKNKFWCGAHCYYLYDVKLNIKYLYYNLKANEKKIQKLRSGACMPNIKKKDLYDFEIWYLSDKSEQEKIVKQLDKVQEIIDLRKKQIEELDELIKSQFVEMFGNIENTKYKVHKLSELTNLITDGEHKKPNYIEKGIPFISVVNITTGELRFEGCKFVSEEDAYKFNKRCNPEKDDILYTKVGATYGRTAIVNTNSKFTLYVSVCLIKPKKELINPIFLNYTMRQPYVKLQADKCIKGIGVPDLHLIEIKNFNIIVPPIEKQNEFAKFVKQIDKQKLVIEKSLKESEELQESLMNKYFGGDKHG